MKLSGRFLLALIVAFLTIGSSAVAQSQPPAGSAPLQTHVGSKVFFISIGGSAMSGLSSSSHPTWRKLLSEGAIGHVAVRVSNHPADAMASLGAIERVQTHRSAGWNFNATETVENGSALDMYFRRAHKRVDGAIVVPTEPQITRANSGQAFGGKVGLLADLLAEEGMVTAAIGNSDHSAGPLPRILPDQQVMSSKDPPETGIHREIALAATNGAGVVPLGDVSRSLLTKDRSAPFGVRTDLDALTAVLDAVIDRASLIAIDTGDPTRADMANRGRTPSIERAGNLVEAVIDRMGSEDLLVVMAPTTPGGPEARGRLRPLILFSRTVPSGLLTSDSTKRSGLVTVPDVAATIAHHLAASDARLGSGRSIHIQPASNPVAGLIDQDRRATTHDKIRNLWAVLSCILMASAMWFGLRGGRTAYLPMAAALPFASYVSIVTWRGGPWLALVSTFAAAALLGLAAQSVSRRQAIPVVAGVTIVFYALDLLTKGSLQLDTLMGYTSIAAGRYYGLGNLGFSALLAASLIAASALVATRRGAITVAGLLVAILLLMGLPQFGNDVGGTITATTAFMAFMLAWLNRRPLKTRHILLAIAVSLIMVVAFGLLDLTRAPSARTHLGDLFARINEDPMALWLVFRRKALLAVTIGIRNPWAVLIIPAAFTYRRLRSDLGASLRSGSAAAWTGAIVGSLVNDSGLAIGGLVLAMWALYLLSERRSTS